MKDNFIVKNEASAPSAEIFVSGFIGESWYDDSSTSEKRFLELFNAIPEGRKITMYVNSEGGSIKDGLGIHAAIARRSADVTAVVTGYALSIASVIPLAASKIVTTPGSMWMLHKPWTSASGNADTLRKVADLLDVHQRSLVAVYKEATEQDEDKINKTLDEETWMTAEEAVAWGLADEISGTSEPLAALNQSRYRRMPMALGAASAPRRENNTTKESIMDAEKNKTAVAEPTTPPTASKAENRDTQEGAVLMGRIHALEARLNAEREARVREQVTAHCNRAGIAAQVENWTKRAMADEAVLADLAGLPSIQAGAEPARGNPVITGGRDAIAIRAELSTPKERHAFDKLHFADVMSAERGRGRGVMGANTHSGLSTMLGTMLVDGISTVLQQRCCALRAVARDFGYDRMKPLTPVIFKQVQAGGTAQTNATNFEDTTNFVGTMEPVTVTPNRITAGAHMTAAELNSGLRIGDFAEVKGAEMANAIMAAVAAVITTGNFTGTPLVSAAASFGASDLKTLWGQLKKANNKSLILDGEYYAQLLPTDRNQWNVEEGGNWPGWNGVFLNTVWTGATTNTTGFALDPYRAIACVAGLPLLPGSGNSPISERSFTVPGIELAVSQQEWTATAGKVEWINWEIVFGAAKNDATAGILIKSA